MQPGAENEGYSTDGAHLPKLRGSWKGQQESTLNERNQGQVLLNEIFEDLRRLSPKMRKIADFCLRNVHSLHRIRILELADQTDNFPSTVVRFAKRYGYVGFLDFKLAFLHEPMQGEIPRHDSSRKDRNSGTNAASRELDVASSCALALKDVLMTTSFHQTVHWTKTARLIGLLARSDDDRPIAMHLERQLNRLHRPTVVLSEQQYLQSNFSEPVDVLFDIDIGLDDRSPDYGKVLPTATTKFVRITASPSSAFSTHVMSHLGLFSYADFPEHLAIAGIALTNAICASLRE